MLVFGSPPLTDPVSSRIRMNIHDNCPTASKISIQVILESAQIVLISTLNEILLDCLLDPPISEVGPID